MSSWGQQATIATISGMEKDSTTTATTATAEVTRGQDQGKKWNDVGWAFAFLGHLGIIAYLGAAFIPQISDDYDGRRLFEEDVGLAGSMVNKVAKIMTNTVRNLHNTVGNRTGHRFLEEMDVDLDGLASLMFIICLMGLAASIASLGVMMKHAEGFIKAGLYFNVASAFLLCVSGFIAGDAMTGILGLLFFLISYCYMRAVWSRIPFAASNLVTATSAIRSNMGVTVFAFFSIILMALWTVLWATTSYATAYIIGGCDENFECESSIGGFTVFLLFVSFFWTVQVIKNVVHVTVAGTVGTWWWSPNEAGSCCSPAVRDSYVRSMTYSFGSICLGSLLVAILQAIKQMCHKMREQNDGCLACLAECIIGCLQSLMEMFNTWAYVYVGLYGYTFVEAANNVMTLFRARGWDAIITDNLVETVLFLVSIGTGLVTGAIAALLSWILDLYEPAGAFFLGFAVSSGLTLVIMSCIGSAVNTVIVCFAEDPNAFKANHPQLSDEMTDSWRKAYPTWFNY